MTWTADRLSQFATGYWSAGALIAAIELNLFDALGEAALDVEQIADRTSTQADRLVALLDGLVASDVLTRRGRTYAITPALRPWLSRESPTSLLDALAYNADLYRRWTSLAEIVRGGEPPAGHASAAPHPEATRRFVRGMDAKARAFSPAIAKRIELSDASSLLDVGSGPGTLSRLLAERHPGLRVTLLDLPSVITVARDLCAGSAVADRLDFHPADYHEGALPGGFDAILYAGALHQESTDAARSLFGRFRQALGPGGQLFVVDLMLDADRASPAFEALFQLNMLLIRPGSRVFTVPEVKDLLASTGWGDAQALDTGTCYRVIRAKPAD